MSGTTCKVCNSSDTDAIEAVGARALTSEISWRAAGRELDLNPVSLKHHMENHFTVRTEREAKDEYDTTIDNAVNELFVAMSSAPAEVKPLYAAAIHNLRELRNTKPSQQHLIVALRTIQEMTGMKQEQRLLLHFAERMFNELPSQKKPELEAANVIDVEPLSETAFASTGESR